MISFAIAMAMMVSQPGALSFGNNPKWTHWCLEASPDLIHWQNFNDYRIETNLDGTWNARIKPTEQQMFFRTVGDFD